MLNKAIKKVVSGIDLSEAESEEVMNSIMSGKEPVSTVSGLLIALKMKGESISEITGCARAMRKMAVPVKLKSDYAIDTCGTGGDGGKTFNISTAASIVAAAGGVKIAKHGNRAVSSKSGSADVLNELGIDINLDKSKVERSIDDIGMGFLFAPMYHSAMKNLAGVRRELGVRTIFNILGPITNPAFVQGQILGVYKRELTNPIAQALKNLGSERVMVVHGKDGLDEITTTSLTYVSELKDGEIKDYTIDPEEYGMERASNKDICGGTAKQNADIIIDILKGRKGKKRDIVVLNSAAALYVGKKSQNIKEGIDMANELIDSNKAYEKLQEILNYSRG